MQKPSGLSNLGINVIKVLFRVHRGPGALRLLVCDRAARISSSVTSFIKSISSSSEMQGLKESNHSRIILGHSDLNLLEKSLMNTLAISFCLSNYNPSESLIFQILFFLLLLRVIV